MLYLISILCTGTWADGIITQAVANVFNLKILSIESYPDFAEITIVEAVNAVVISSKFNMKNSYAMRTWSDMQEVH